MLVERNNASFKIKGGRREKKKKKKGMKKKKEIRKLIIDKYFFHRIWRRIEKKKNVRQGKFGSRDGETARVAYVALRYNIISLYLDEFLVDTYVPKPVSCT